jgi:hypothetical protein
MPDLVWLANLPCCPSQALNNQINCKICDDVCPEKLVWQDYIIMRAGIVELFYGIKTPKFQPFFPIFFFPN